MTFRLAPTAQARGFRIEAHETIGSTNSRAIELAQRGDPGQLWVVARQQESGRGRRGRAWATPPGNLAATLLIVTDRDLKLAATLGFVAGLALAEALEAAAPLAKLAIAADGAGRDGLQFSLKWPNDVLVGGAKLAGILLESTLIEGERAAVAVGIGVNVVAHPTDVPYPAISLAALGATADAETLFLSLSDAMSDGLARWNGGRGLEEVRRRWLKRAAGLGGEVAVRVEGDVVRGVFETIDEDCRFVIRDETGRLVRIAAGDVHFGAVASAGAA